MAASPVPESMPGTPRPPTITSPGTGSQPEVRGLKLNKEWAVGERIIKGNGRHSVVYSVLVSETGQLAEDLEAHVFALDDIEPKLRKHRQRCIKRMEGRTKLETKAEGVTIVVITTSPTMHAGASYHVAEPGSLSDDGQRKTVSGTSVTGKAKQKTPCQIELRRVRQRERRQAKRRAEAGQGDGRTIDSGHKIAQKIDQDILIDGKNEFSMFVSFVHDMLDGWDLWEEIPAMHAGLAKNIEGGCTHEVFAAALETIQELQSYLKVS